VNDQPTPLDVAERALRDSETRLQQVLDNSSALIFAKDPRGRYLFVNREFERIARRPAGEIIGRTDEEVFPSDVATRFRYNDLRVLHEKRAYEFEEAGDFGEGMRTYLAAKFPLFDAVGEAYAVCGVATDISDRKRLEEALSSAALAVSQAEGEALYRELARYLATILRVDCAFIATHDPAGGGQMRMRAFHMNGETRENFNYALRGTPCEIVMGHGFRYYPARLPELFPIDTDFRDLGFEAYAGHPLTGAAGRPLGIIAVVSRSALDQPAFVESVLRIFSVRIVAELERVAAHDALRASQDSYREIFEASEDAVFVHDWDTGAILDANPQACASYGYSLEEFRNLRLGDLSSGVPPYTEVEGQRWIERAKVEGSVRFEWHRRNRDGRLRWDEVRLKAARIGGLQRVLAFTNDITDSKLAEERRRALEAQLRQAQRMEAIGQLTGGIAHDFNNLLTGIMGYVALAAEHETVVGDRRLAGYLAQAQRSCVRARDLIQQMLMFSRGQRGSPRPVALGRLVEDSLASLRPTLPRPLEVRLAVAPELPAVRVDPLQVEQVLLNLCINARDACDGTGTVQVEVQPARSEGLECAGCRGSVDGDFVELAVTDSGPGIPAAVAERIFEPFFSTKESGKGTGMGLAIVHGIVHEHGGHVLVESPAGGGARFRVLWPALPEALLEAALERPAESRTLAGRHAARPAFAGAVLVVDDEATVGEFMRELLETWGLRATWVPGGPAALELVAATPERFDAIITDQSMPRMTGLQLAQALRASRPDLPVILYTGYAEGLARSELEGAGIRAVLRKPVEPGALEAALAGVLGPAGRDA
jgi:two-component system, cell cycle sensor histidine kinase and response regulator CckA